MLSSQADRFRLPRFRPVPSLPRDARRRGHAALLVLFVLLAGGSEAAALRIVAVGASNTSGWGVGREAAYPARLEELLKAKGVEAEVINAGVPFETTSGMLARIDRDVPDGTAIVIIQPGGNDLRFLGTRARRTANIDAMVARIRLRGMEPIVYDPDFPRDAYQWDFIHINAAGHGAIAADLLPAVMGVLKPDAPRSKASRKGLSPVMASDAKRPRGGAQVPGLLRR